MRRGWCAVAKNNRRGTPNAPQTEKAAALNVSLGNCNYALCQWFGRQSVPVCATLRSLRWFYKSLMTDF